MASELREAIKRQIKSARTEDVYKSLDEAADLILDAVIKALPDDAINAIDNEHNRGYQRGRTATINQVKQLLEEAKETK